MTRRLSPRSAVAGLAALALTITLSACTASDGGSPSSHASASASGAASSAPGVDASTGAQEPAAFLPDADATANLPIFTEVVNTVWASDARGEGRAYIDALVATGFSDKTAMQVTPDQTGIGQTAESILFSVRWQGSCLVGQVGPATGDPVTAVQQVLPGDVCLIGTTRPIDW